MEKTEGTVLAMFYVAVVAALVGAVGSGAILHLSFGEWAGWFSIPILILLLALFVRKWVRWSLR